MFLQEHFAAGTQCHRINWTVRDLHAEALLSPDPGLTDSSSYLLSEDPPGINCS
jgi:hypothetical protein